ncbi:outer membrane protein assembly factor BamB family protein [Mycolicibacterium mengxianglii]|uniref:outer membrane protein assembly factor BamB family protein n=1 Tax=Mycolicibacterium mengxianglii TaxID=2736649 RepID=UPI0018D0DD72|nr:PQQ-binding-like beta-propeller repeat protein [Mycolicibacterium mengxianglii]
MTNDNASGFGRLGWRLTQACAGIAAVTLGCAAALGAWSLTAAGRIELPHELTAELWYRTPESTAMTAVAVAVALLVLLLAARTAKHLMVTIAAALVTAIVGIYFLVNSGDVIAVLRATSVDFVRSQQVPAAAVAWLLAAAGSLAALFGIAPPPRRTGPVALVVGLVLATAGSAGAVWAAVRAGDDSRFVDATQAADAPIPPVPADLGERVFSMKVSDRNESDSSDVTDVTVAAAGAGFIALQDGTLTAYDSAGRPRWHYRRTGPGDLAVQRANVYDGGRTVILLLHADPDRQEPAALVALDAMTGEQLWMSTAPSLVAAFGSASNSDLWPHQWSWPARHLIARSDEGWKAYDPRTGAALWSIDSPQRCEDAGEQVGGDVVERADAVMAFTQCSQAGAVTVTARTLDPRTGEVTASVPVVTGQYPVHGRRYLDITVTPAGEGGVAYSVKAKSGEHLGYLSTEGALRSSQVQPYSIVTSTESVPEFLAGRVDDDPARTVYGPDGVPRCSTPAGVPQQPYSGTDVSWLADQFVLYMFTDLTQESGTLLQSFDRQTCAPMTRIPQPWGSVRGIGAAPGVFLAVRTDRTGTHIDGYSGAGG